MDSSEEEDSEVLSPNIFGEEEGMVACGAILGSTVCKEANILEVGTLEGGSGTRSMTCSEDEGSSEGELRLGIIGSLSLVGHGGRVEASTARGGDEERGFKVTIGW